jgi:DNA polymerase III epsilon subunit-like protein
VHGITDADVADQPTMSHFAPQIVAFLRDSDLAGFNIARFDVPFLQTELNRCGCPLEIDKIRLIDVQVIFHKKEPRDLTAALRFYCQKEHNEAHDALGDVRATVDVFHAQLERYTDLPHTVAALHRLAPAEPRIGSIRTASSTGKIPKRFSVLASIADAPYPGCKKTISAICNGWRKRFQSGDPFDYRGSHRR